MNRSLDGTLPRGWRLARFSEIMRRVERKITIDDSVLYDCVGVRWYGMGTFVRKHLLGMNIVRKNQWVIRKGDVVYNKLFAWKGSFAIADVAVDGCIVSDKFPTYLVDSEKIHPPFLSYYLRTSELAQKAQDLSRGAAAISKLTLNPPQFWELTIPLPTLDEQRRITARVEGIVGKINEARQLRQQASQEAKALLASSRSEKFESKGSDSWPTLADVCSKVTDGTHETPMYVSSGVPFLTGKDISPDCLDFRKVSYISPEDHRHFKGHCNVERGDLLLTLIGTIDKVAIVDTDREFSVKNVGLLKPNPERLDSRYLFHFLQSSAFRRQAVSYAKRTAQSFVGLKKLRTARVPCPPLAEQRQIAAYLDQLRQLLETAMHLQAKTQGELEALLPSVLDKAFKGEL